MQGRQLAQSDALSTSFWFIPALVAVAGAALAVTLIMIDRHLLPDQAQRWPRLLSGGPANSREILSTLASASITVMGVLFSITVVALSLASTQYSTRVLRTFMHDRTTQVVMGLFAATFVYAITVIRAVTEEHGQASFVPHLAVNGAILFGIVDIGAVIYFVHHLSRSIQAMWLLGEIASDTLDVIGSRYPDGLGEASEASPEEDPRAAVVLAPRSGYLRSVGGDEIIAAAERADVVVRLRRAPGESVAPRSRRSPRQSVRRMT